MFFFKYFTPVSYWFLTLLWSFIFIFYVKRIIRKNLKSPLFITLLTILAIDAFRTLVESVYFGFWYSSLLGFLPRTVYEILIRPENVFIPKFINVVAALLIIFIVLRRWVPEEMAERERDARHTRNLEDEIRERIAIQNKLALSEKQLIEAQELARLGYYVFNMEMNSWSSSSVLNGILGIDEEYEKDFEGWLNLIHPDDRQMMQTYFEKDIFGEHKEFNKEYRVVNTGSGKVLWVHGIGHLKLGDDGNLKEVFGTIQDISEHKKLVNDLEEALENIKVLGGLIPICSHCKSIRDDKGYWSKLETYLNRHSDISFSHSLCPKCAEELYGKENWYHKLTEED